MTKYLITQLIEDTQEGSITRRLCVIWNDFITHRMFYNQISNMKYKNDVRILVESDFRRAAEIADEWPNARVISNKIEEWLVENPKFLVNDNDNMSAIDGLRKLVKDGLPKDCDMVTAPAAYRYGG